MSNTTGVRGSVSGALKMRSLRDLGAKSGTRPIEPNAPGDNIQGLNKDSNDGGRRQKNKRYERHTPSQIKGLEAFFKECTRPDITQREKLGQELGLEQWQVKFWFQNKRTHVKVQRARHDATFLRAENERLRKENAWFKQILGATSPDFNGPPAFDEMFLEGQHPNELDRAPNVASENIEEPLNSNSPYIPAPLSLLPPNQVPAQPTCVGQTHGETSLTMARILEEGRMYYPDWSFLDDDLTIVTNQANIDEVP